MSILEASPENETGQIETVFDLFAVYIEDADEEFSPYDCTFEQAEENGYLLQSSSDITTLLDVLISGLNQEELTDHNWYIVFKNKKHYLS